MSTAPNRRFNAEINGLYGQKVCVILANGKEYKGVMRGISSNDMTVVLGDAFCKEETYHRVFLTGHSIAEITVTEEPFDLSGLARELSLTFQAQNVKFFEEKGIIKVLDRISITKDGVTGTGPVADRIRAIFEKFATKHEESQAKK